MAQAGQPFPAEASVQSQASPCGIYCGQSSTATGFPPSISVFFCQYHSTNVPFSLMYFSPTLCGGSSRPPKDLFLLCFLTKVSHTHTQHTFLISPMHATFSAPHIHGFDNSNYFTLSNVTTINFFEVRPICVYVCSSYMCVCVDTCGQVQPYQ